MKQKITVIAAAFMALTVAILIIISNSNTAPVSTPSLSSSDISSIGKFAKIKPTDSEDVKERKRQYNELQRKWDKMDEEHQKKLQSNTLTKEEDEDFSRKTVEIGDKMRALGIDPTEDETADEKFRSNIDGYISTCELGKSMYLDDHGNVNPADREKYERACRKEEYLKKVKKDYEEGKITADEALKSFDEFNNIK